MCCALVRAHLNFNGGWREKRGKSGMEPNGLFPLPPPKPKRPNKEQTQVINRKMEPLLGGDLSWLGAPAAYSYTVHKKGPKRRGMPSPPSPCLLLLLLAKANRRSNQRRSLARSPSSLVRESTIATELSKKGKRGIVGEGGVPAMQRRGKGSHFGTG